ncbi:MAG: hypothetical protein US50_C0005G0008 [Candidatus Nomurabacteria bacterium GW2011_GWB1_37_5]|uniref:Uncharacterized protein n=1 Tax=Candidatus Nomurabacteria bacterium GW2011_GWB1_37_5 TaxID=1618742 RepID=A0A0G0H0P7_9BACT|nr:MAG: hypothetical protein US50_C0005G0008 [Candidatus Nomurabacteria bacterium GW2011_GWB1_37_5]
MSKTSVLDRISFYSLLTTISLLPFFFLPYFQFSLPVGKGVLVSIGLVISVFFWFLARMVDGKIDFPKSPLILTGFILATVSLLAAIFSPNKILSIWGNAFEMDSFFYLFVLMIGLFLSSYYFSDKRNLSKFYIFIFVSFLISGLFMIVNLFVNLGTIAPNFFSGISSSNLIGSLNDLAIFSGLILLICLFAFENLPSNPTIKILLTIFSILSLFFLSLADYQAVWIILGILSIVMFVLGFSRIHSGSTDSKRWPVFPLIIFLISLFFILSKGSFVAKMLNVQNLDVRPSISLTGEIIGRAWSNNPLVGAGPGRFVNSWLSYKSSEINNTVFWDTNFNFGFGLIPSFLVTTGVLGGLSWLLFLVFLVLVLKRAFSSKIKDNFTNFIMTTSAFAAIYLWIFAIIYVPSNVVYTLAFIFSGAVIGILVSTKDIKSVNLQFLKDPRLSFFSILLLVILMIGSATLTYKFIQKFASMIQFNSAVILSRDEAKFDLVESKLIKAIELSKNDLYMRSLSEYYLLKLNNLVKNATAADEATKNNIQDAFSKAEQSAAMAINSDKTNYLNYLTLATLYENVASLQVPNAIENAKAAYGEAKKLNPLNPGIDLKLARLALAEKNNTDAIKLIDESLVKKPNFVDAYVLKAQIYYSEGDKNLAIQNLQTALSFDPQNKDLKSNLEALKKEQQVPVVVEEQVIQNNGPENNQVTE